MEWTWINVMVLGISLLANGVAVYCAVQARQQRAPAPARRLVSQCGYASAAVAAICLVGVGMGLVQAFGAVASAGAMDKATRLAMGISTAMNCIGFMALALLIPAASLIYCALRVRRLERQAKG